MTDPFTTVAVAVAADVSGVSYNLYAVERVLCPVLVVPSGIQKVPEYSSKLNSVAVPEPLLFCVSQVLARCSLVNNG